LYSIDFLLSVKLADFNVPLFANYENVAENVQSLKNYSCYVGKIYVV